MAAYDHTNKSDGDTLSAADWNNLGNAVETIDTKGFTGVNNAGAVWVNGDNLGMVGDWNGSTGTDNSAALQAIHDALPSGGGCIVLSANKRYRFASAVNITKGAVTIMSFGGPSAKMGGSDTGTGCELVATTASQKLFNVDAGSLNHLGPHFENLNFYDNVGSSCTLAYLRLVNRWTFRNCSFSNAAKSIHLWSDAPAEGGAVAGGDCAWGMIDQCIFKEGVDAVYSQHSYGFTILGGEIDGFTTGINLVSPSTGTGNQHVRVFGVKFDACAVCIELNGSSNVVLGCGFEQRNMLGGIGVRIGNGFTSRRNHVAHNTFVGSQSSGHTQYGIILDTNAGAAGNPNWIGPNGSSNISNPITDNSTADNYINGVLPSGFFGIRMLNASTNPTTGIERGEIYSVNGTLKIVNNSGVLISVGAQS